MGQLGRGESSKKTAKGKERANSPTEPQATKYNKVQEIKKDVEHVQAIMNDNMTLVIERGKKLEDLCDKSETLNLHSQDFHQGAKWLKRTQKWRYWGMTLVTAVALITFGYALYHDYSLLKTLLTTAGATLGTYATFQWGLDFVWDFCIEPFIKKEPVKPVISPKVKVKKRPSLLQDDSPQGTVEVSPILTRLPTALNPSAWLPAAQGFFQRASNSQDDVIAPGPSNNLDPNRHTLS